LLCLSGGDAVPVVFADAPAEDGDAAGFSASFAASGFSASYFPAGEFPGELVAWGRMVVDDISTALPSTIACGRFGSPDPADPDPDPAVPGVALPASSFLSVMGTRYSTK